MFVLRNTFYPLLAVLLIVSFGCKKKTPDAVVPLTGSWSKQSSIDGSARTGAAGFTIGSKFYMGTGFDGTNNARLKDFWVFDTITGWQKIAPFPGAGRSGAVGFSLNNSKGYVGSGYDGSKFLNDFYEYDPASNTWNKQASMPDNGRQDAVAFGIDANGYVGTGYAGDYKKDFWKFYPSESTGTPGDTGRWVSIISLKGDKRRNASAFVINGKGYVGLGAYATNYLNDMWEFNPSDLSWISKAAPSADTDGNGSLNVDASRTSGAAFTINKKGYVTVGYYNSVYTGTTYEFDPVANTWTQKTNFAGGGRTGALGFSITDAVGKERGFVFGGINQSTAYDDLWEFLP